MAKSKAIYKYFPQGIPSAYTIDATVCRNFQEGKKCGVCAKICQAGAIDYKQEEQIINLDVGAIILATGYELFDAGKIPEYGYGRLPNVVTALEFERLLSASGPTHGHLYRPSDLSVKDSLPELEKAVQKGLRELEKFEKPSGMSSADFIKKYDGGELTGEQYDQWAKAFKLFVPVKEKLDDATKKIESMETPRIHPVRGLSRQAVQQVLLGVLLYALDQGGADSARARPHRGNIYLRDGHSRGRQGVRGVPQPSRQCRHYIRSEQGCGSFGKDRPQPRSVV